MKKINVVPLLAITVLSMVGCTNNNNDNDNDNNNNKCSFVFEGADCFMEHEKSYDKGTQLTLKIGTYPDYVLPKNITVEGNDNYTYIRESGEFKVTINNNIKVTCDAISPEETYSFSLQCLNCSSNSLSKYPKNEEVEIFFKSDETYDLPYTVHCTGFENYSFDKSNGLFKGEIIGDASLKVIASKNPEYQYVHKEYEYNEDHSIYRITTYDEKFVDGKKELTKGYIYPYRNYINYEGYKYDANDRLIVNENYQISYEGGKLTKTFTEVFNYSYFEDGKLKEIDTISSNDIDKKSIYSYGDLSNGYYQEEAFYKEGVIFLYRKTETIIDEEKNTKTEYYYEKDPWDEYGNYIKKTTYSLETGKILELAYTDSNEAKYTFIYNENNELLTEEKTNKDGKVSFLENHFNEDGTISCQTRSSFDGNDYVLNVTYKFTLNDAGFIERVDYYNASDEYTGGLCFEYGLNEIPFAEKEEQRPLGVGNYDGNYLLIL